MGLFQNASYVCTNSFHGTVFSVQFQKPFFTAVAPAELAEPESSRTFSILSRLGLTDRIIGKGDTAGLDGAIHWETVEKRLGDARQSSMAYLRAALAGEAYCEAAPAAPTEERSAPILAERGRCTGCGACASGCPKDAISMERDKEGFL